MTRTTRLPIAHSALQHGPGMRLTGNQRCTDMGGRYFDVMHKEQQKSKVNRKFERRHVVTP